MRPVESTGPDEVVEDGSSIRATDGSHHLLGRPENGRHAQRLIGLVRMEGRLVLKDCSLFRTDGRVRGGMAVVVVGATIVRVAADAEVPALPGDWVVNCAGRLVTPGLVDCSTRLVGGVLAPWSADSLLRVHSARVADDRALGAQLTPEHVEAITLWSLARGLRLGVTMFVEQLYAPACVQPALEAQAKAARFVGARLINAHASTSAEGRVPGPAQVEANAAYVKSVSGDPLVRGAIGVGASFATHDDVLRAAGHFKEELACGAHFPLAETNDDLAHTWNAHGTRVTSRFERFGLLGGGSVGSHARAIDRSEAERLARTRTLVALSPRTSHVSEGGSAFGTEAVFTLENLLGLGTNGTCSLWEELAASFSGVMSLARTARTIDPDAAISSFLLGGPAELCTMVFGKPSGSIDVGALADLVVFDHIPTPDAREAMPSIVMQLAQTQAAWTIVNGRVVVREGQLVGHDLLELARASAAAISSVRRRAHAGATGDL